MHVLFIVLSIFEFCTVYSQAEDITAAAVVDGSDYNWVEIDPGFPDISYQITRDSFSLHMKIAGPIDNWFGIALSRDLLMTDDDIAFIYKGDEQAAVVHRLGRHAKGYDLTDDQSMLVTSDFVDGFYTFHVQMLVLNYQLWEFPAKEDPLNFLFAFNTGEYAYHGPQHHVEPNIQNMDLENLYDIYLTPDEEFMDIYIDVSDVAMDWLQFWHALLNAFAWGVAIPYTVFISTLKEIICVDMVQDWVIFADDLPQPIWLNIHRLLSVVAAICTIIAFICGIFMAKYEQFTKMHHTLGFGLLPALILLFAISMIRPPGPPRGRRNITWSRWKWDVVHQSLGNMVLIAGCVQLNLGVDLLKEMGIISAASVIPAVFKGVVIAFVGICVAIQCAKAVLMQIYPNTNFPVKSFETISGGSDPSPESSSTPSPDSEQFDKMFDLDDEDDIDTGDDEYDEEEDSEYDVDAPKFAIEDLVANVHEIDDDESSSDGSESD